jgi:hypothetical protein
MARVQFSDVGYYNIDPSSGTGANLSITFRACRARNLITLRRIERGTGNFPFLTRGEAPRWYVLPFQGIMHQSHSTHYLLF